jgi:hypothetical protein
LNFLSALIEVGSKYIPCLVSAFGYLVSIISSALEQPQHFVDAFQLDIYYPPVNRHLNHIRLKACYFVCAMRRSIIFHSSTDTLNARLMLRERLSFFFSIGFLSFFDWWFVEF